MKVSLSTHLFVFYKLDEKILEFIKNNGFDNIEIWGMRPHFDYYDEAYLKRIRKIITRLELNVTSFHAPMYRFVGDAAKGLWLMLSDRDEEKRKAAVEETVHLLNKAELFQPMNLVIHPDLSTDDFESTLTNLKRSLDELRIHCDKLKIKLAIETGIKQSNISSKVLEVVKNLDSNLFGICVDVGHANVGEEPVKALDVCMNHLLEVHVSDNNGDGDSHLVPGEGTMDWVGIINKLQEKNFSGNFVFEIMDPYRDNTLPVQEFATVFEKLKSFRRRFNL